MGSENERPTGLECEPFTARKEVRKSSDLFDSDSCDV
jgi:hypothetical protein